MYFLNVTRNVIWRLTYVVSEPIRILNSSVLIKINFIINGNDKYDKPTMVMVHGHIALALNLLLRNSQTF